MIGCTDVTFGNSTDKMSQTGQVHQTQKRKNNLEDYLETQPAGQHDYATEHHHSVEQQVLHGQKQFQEPTYMYNIHDGWLREFYNVESRPSDPRKSHTNEHEYHDTSAQLENWILSVRDTETEEIQMSMNTSTQKKLSW